LFEFLFAFPRSSARFTIPEMPARITHDDLPTVMAETLR
jgi:hypothetical protein